MEDRLDLFEPPMSPFFLVDPEEYAMLPETEYEQLQKIPEGRHLRFEEEPPVRLRLALAPPALPSSSFDPYFLPSENLFEAFSSSFFSSHLLEELVPILLPTFPFVAFSESRC